MLSTIGYEGADARDFVRTLKQAGVEVLVDVRDRAQSRRKGFSKSALREMLNLAGIEYVHLKELGDPKEGRQAARSGDYPKFRKIYNQVLRSSAALEAIDSIKNIMQKQHACMLCYERDPSTCHRKLIADKIEAESELKARHLGVQRFEQAA